MSVDLEQFDQKAEEDTWRIVLNYVNCMNEAMWAGQVDDVKELFKHPIAQKMAKLLLFYCQKAKTATFLSSDQLFDIASQKRENGRDRLEMDIPASPGIYFFVSGADEEVLKVGQARDMQVRIGNSHLRNGSNKKSDLKPYCESMWNNWPNTLREQQISALLLELPKSSEEERRFFEKGLQELTKPPMT